MPCHRRSGALGLVLLLTGCRYRLLPESRICDDLAFALSERSYVCDGDGTAANDRHDAFVEATRCLLPDEVEDPYNPNGILPADDKPEERARIERLYDCVRAARAAECTDVAAEGDDPAFWLGLDPACAEVAELAGGAR